MPPPSSPRSWTSSPRTSDWAALAAVLRRIISGDRDASLLEGLDPVDTAITGQVLARLAQPPDAPTQEDP